MGQKRKMLNLRVFSKILALIIVIFNISFAKNVAFIIDSTASLENVLPEEKKSIKMIMELMSLVEPNSYFCVVKFGNYNEGEIIVSDYVKKENIKEVLRKVDENLTLKSLYRTKTDFAKGIELVLETNRKYDYTFFITDGEDNYENSLKEIESLKHRLPDLGKVIFVLVPNNKYGYLRNKYKNRFQKWKNLLDAEEVRANKGNIFESISKFLLKEKIEGKIFGYGKVEVLKNLSFDKYENASNLMLFIFPAIKIREVRPYKGSVYTGEVISAVILDDKSPKGKYTIETDYQGIVDVVFFETARIQPVLELYPKRENYYINESINYSLHFKVNNTTVKSTIFEESLYCELNVGNKKFQGKYKEIKNGVVSFPEKKDYKVCIKFSYFENKISKEKCRYIGSIHVSKSGNLLNITILPDKDIYAYQPIKIKAYWDSWLKKDSIPLKINDRVVVLPNIQDKWFIKELKLSPGTYVISSLSDEYVLSGKTTFKVLDRSIKVTITGEDGKINEYKVPLSSNFVPINLKLKYLYSDDHMEKYTVNIDIKPAFKYEKINFTITTPDKIEIPVIFKKYIFLGLNSTLKGKLKIRINKNQNSLVAKIFREDNIAIGRFIENSTHIGEMSNIQIFNKKDNTKIAVSPDKKIILKLSVDTYSKYVFLSMLAAKYTFMLLSVAAGLFIILLLLGYYLRLLYKKKKLWREAIDLSFQDFWDKLPKNVRNELIKLGFNKDLIEESTFIDSKTREKLLKVYKKWKLKDLEEFLKLLKTPIKHLEKQNLSLPIYISSFKKGKNIIRLRDDSIKDLELKIGYKHSGFSILSNKEFSIDNVSYAPGFEIEIKKENNKISIEVGKYLIEVVRNMGNRVNVRIERIS